MTSKKPETGAGKMVRAFYEARLKKKEADFKLKQSLQKMAFSQKLKEFSEGKKQQAKVMSPEQQFLRRRFEEENPIAAMEIPEEGSDSQEVSFPATKVEPSSGGMMKEVNIPKEKQPLMFMTAYNKMIAAGKKPSPLATKIYEKYYKQVNKPKEDKKDNKSKEYSPNKQTRDLMEAFSKAMQEGDIKSKDDVADFMRETGDTWKMRGADTEYAVSRAYNILPDEHVQENKGFLGFGSRPELKRIGGQWFKKTKDGWTATQAPKNAKRI